MIHSISIQLPPEQIVFKDDCIEEMYKEFGLSLKEFVKPRSKHIPQSHYDKFTLKFTLEAIVIPLDKINQLPLNWQKDFYTMVDLIDKLAEK